MKYGNYKICIFFFSEISNTSTVLCHKHRLCFITLNIKILYLTRIASLKQNIHSNFSIYVNQYATCAIKLSIQLFIVNRRECLLRKILHCPHVSHIIFTGIRRKTRYRVVSPLESYCPSGYFRPGLFRGSFRPLIVGLITLNFSQAHRLN